ncbi:hypothetical protein POTOM_000380 [Populus tomentosa]|uniref:Uncharacterized protein n=1 Tax=Populus tomentosa TaxID=118781 RepID=A0A8X8AR54_POPTO|nr:hypothetical protein POTOM_000380 [Populus tomentosa]
MIDNEGIFRSFDKTEEFRSFIVGRRIADELYIPFDKTRNHSAALATKHVTGNFQMFIDEVRELVELNARAAAIVMKTVMNTVDT